MKFTPDISRGDWLHARLDASPDECGTVGGVAGTGWEAYARILHPVPATRYDPPHPDRLPDEAWESIRTLDEATWGWAEVARRNGRRMHPAVQWFSLTDNETEMSWDDGWQAGQTDTGHFPPDLLAALTPHLDRATDAVHDLTAAVWIGWGELNPGGGSQVAVAIYVDDDTTHAEASATAEAMEHQLATEMRDAVDPEIVRAVKRRRRQLRLPGREYVLLTTALSELADPGWTRTSGLGWHGGFDGVTPQLLWPADQRWLVASEIDWDSTIVAGPRALVDAVLADPAFEAYEVTAKTDLSVDGDTLNPAPTAEL